MPKKTEKRVKICPLGFECRASSTKHYLDYQHIPLRLSQGKEKKKLTTKK